MGTPRQTRASLSPILAALFALLLSLPLSPAHADGKVFARQSVVTNIPDQRALIHFSGGIQTLIIETRFVASDQPSDGPDPSASDHFAWVVPLPSVPELIEVSPGLLPTTAAIFNPEVSAVLPYGSALAVACILLLATLLLISGRGTLHLVLAALLLIAVMFIILLLPSLGRARSLASSGPTTDVTLHDRRIVGHLDVATISSPEGTALISWLNDNGFAVPPDSEAVINTYASEGWAFCAARLSPSQERADHTASTPYPLGFRFPTDKPIYPMRLTATGSTSLDVDLYVFGSAMASAPHFKPIRCATPREWDDRAQSYRSGPRHAVRVGHEGLLALTRGSSTATKLSATLSPEQMRQDVVIDWTTPRSMGHTVHSNEGALNRAINIGSGIVIVASLAVLILTPLLRLSAATAARALTLSILLAALVSLIAWLTTPTVPTIQGDRYRSPVVHHFLESQVWAEIDYDPAAPYRHATVEGMRTILKSAAAKARETWSIKADLREEDSPFNYTIRIEDGFIMYVGHDQWGRGQTRYKLLEVAPPSMPVESQPHTPAGATTHPAPTNLPPGES